MAAIIKDEHKPILGTLNAEGVPVKWPPLNMNRGRYNRPATTQQITPELFVVLPANFKEWDAVDALKAEYAAKPTIRAAAPKEKAEG